MNITICEGLRKKFFEDLNNYWYFCENGDLWDSNGYKLGYLYCPFCGERLNVEICQEESEEQNRLASTGRGNRR